MIQNPTSILAHHGLRKTPMRVQVLQVFLLNRDQALSSHQLETGLPDADRITLYRTLRTFEQKGIIHQALDGTLNQKYALCSGACTEHQHLDQHAHFHCSVCGKTICLDEVNQLLHQMPAGFIVHSSHLILRGSCPDCTFRVV